MRIVFSILLLASFPVFAHAQAPHIDRIDVVEYGIYSVTSSGAEPAPGEVIKRTGENLVAKTRTVPATLGVHFGFMYSVVGTPSGQRKPIKLVMIFPSAGVYNPQTKQTDHRQQGITNPRIGYTSYADYSFDVPTDLVPGTYVFELWDGTRKMVEQKFTVVKK